MDVIAEDVLSLSDFIRRQEREFPDTSEHFANILSSIALGTKIVSRAVNRAGLGSLLGAAGEKNVQGEEVQKLDIYADKVFARLLDRSGEVLSMVSEEQEKLIEAHDSTSDANYVIAFDPLDGSSNIDVNVSIGTIWGVYHNKVWSDGAAERDFMQPGRKQVAAGYTIYGSSTMFVYTTGHGVNGFTLDPDTGEFFLTNPNMQMPKRGTIYSCNEGNFEMWDAKLKRYISSLKTTDGGKKKPLTQRYVGSLVADFHRTMLKGGLFLYPADTKNQDGKLRLLYECAPMAFIAEQAGGKASNGQKDILDLVPQKIHQRTPLYIGSSEQMDELLAAAF